MRGKRKFFWGKYENKSEGALRYYDLKSGRVRVWVAVAFIICLIMVFVAIFPMIWAILSGFKDSMEFNQSTRFLPGNFNFSRYATTWQQLDFGKFYRNSAIHVAGGVVCAVLFNGLLAYALAILKPVGHKIISGMVLACMLIPPTTTIVALYVNINTVMRGVGDILGTKLNGSFASFVPLWLVLGANAFWVILFKQYFEGIPKDYIEAAQLDGCSNLQIFFRILLPLSRPIIGVIAIFAVTTAWSDFLLPYLLLNNSDYMTVMVRLFAFNSNRTSAPIDILRAVVFSLIPPAILFGVFQKQITGGIAVGGIKG